MNVLQVFKSMQLAEEKARGNIFQGLHKEVLEHLRSKDKKKYFRALDLLRKHDEIKEARKVLRIHCNFLILLLAYVANECWRSGDGCRSWTSTTSLLRKLRL